MVSRPKNSFMIENLLNEPRELEQNWIFGDLSRDNGREKSYQWLDLPSQSKRKVYSTNQRKIPFLQRKERRKV